ncbi:PD-(D/E)XK nuclease family protein [Lutibacter sp.]|uniref:PD-(D/E)XK nuclease family protein n=1 Tax=Lutibacter sp. TaxID=1925666 RepID=UPI0035665F5B
MNSFISKVVKDVKNRQKNISEVTFVLPSQRSCVFLKDELVASSNTAMVLPKIVSIENFIQELADIQLIDSIQLIFEFYSIYKKKMPIENVDSFETFSQWATIALHDFNELDSYLVNTEDFFSNLSDIKKLNEWFEDKKPSELAVNYFQFFENLNLLYNSLYKELKKNKIGYQGLIYREATKNLEYFIQNQTSNHFFFVGFNALNKSEETIFQELLNNNLATVYWDVNQHILNNTNEAGSFLRRFKKEWTYYKSNPFLWIEETDVLNKNIEIIGVPKNNTQIKYVGELLAGFNKFNETALVLADENLLPITLNSLPNNVENINITMGYPLKDIPIASLFDKIFKLHINQQKLTNNNNQRFYYKDVLALLNDPFLNQLNGEILQKLIAKIKFENSIFLSVQNLKDFLTTTEIENFQIVLSLFKFSGEIEGIIQQCLTLINKLRGFVIGVEKEYLFRFFGIFQQLDTLNAKYNHIKNLKTLSLFYKQLLQNEKLSFKGEPLKGLQLMGMLETRVLDFETVIITSVNEGVLPGGKNDFSFIPYDVKRYFGLPTYQEKDAIFSYHFQRLLQRASNVYLLYNTEMDGYGSGEKSRFLTKLEIENSTINKKVISPIVQKNESEVVQVNKTPEVLERLQEIFTAGISPSAIANYIYNPIKFYEQKVLKIKDDNDVEETVAVNTMGTVIHGVLEALYTPFINKPLTEDVIKQMKLKINDLLVVNFEEHYKKGNIKTGKNNLIFEVCKTNIERFLNQEEALLKQGKQLKIIALEKELEITLKVEGIDFPIKIKGIVDRIDELDGVTRIIDYKTGKVEAKDLKINDFSVLSVDYKFTKALQVLIYSYLFIENPSNGDPKLLEAGIISFKNLNNGFLKLNFSEKGRGQENLISKEHLDLFMVELQQIFIEIMNPNTPFKQNENLPF